MSGGGGVWDTIDKYTKQGCKFAYQKLELSCQQPTCNQKHLTGKLVCIEVSECMSIHVSFSILNRLSSNISIYFRVLNISFSQNNLHSWGIWISKVISTNSPIYSSCYKGVSKPSLNSCWLYIYLYTLYTFAQIKNTIRYSKLWRNGNMERRLPEVSQVCTAVPPDNATHSGLCFQ